MRATRTGGAGTHREPAREFCLAGCGERRAFLVTHTDPFDAASADCVRQWVQGVTDQCEDLLDTDLLEHADQDIRYCFSHSPLRVSLTLRRLPLSLDFLGEDVTEMRKSRIGTNGQHLERRICVERHLLPFDDRFVLEKSLDQAVEQ